jgi:hypothetical protein
MHLPVRVRQLPSAVRVSSTLLVAYGLLSLLVGLADWLLIGPVSWIFFVALLLVTTMFLAVGVKLLQLRYWAMLAGRLLALWLVVGYLALIATGRFAVISPVLTLARVTQFIVAIALAIAVFLPAVSKAIKRPPDATQPEGQTAVVTPSLFGASPRVAARHDEIGRGPEG